MIGDGYDSLRRSTTYIGRYRGRSYLPVAGRRYHVGIYRQLGGDCVTVMNGCGEVVDAITVACGSVHKPGSEYTACENVSHRNWMGD